jgi:phage protein U
MSGLTSVLDFVSDIRTAIAVSSVPALTAARYAQLGDIVFEVVGPITGVESKCGFTFAQHDVIESKPRLQATGDELEVLTLTLAFNSTINDPVTAYADLVSVAAAHQAMPFVFAGGQILGRYVISEIDDTIDHTDTRGAVTRRTTRVTLTEWVQDQPLEIAAATRRTAAVAKTAAAPKVTKPKPGDPTYGYDLPENVSMAVLLRAAMDATKAHEPAP